MLPQKENHHLSMLQLGKRSAALSIIFITFLHEIERTRDFTDQLISPGLIFRRMHQSELQVQYG